MKKTLFLILVLASTNIFSHSGRTDSSGCHVDRKNGGYHCHNSGYSSVTTPKYNSPATAVIKSEPTKTVTKTPAKISKPNSLMSELYSYHSGI